MATKLELATSLAGMMKASGVEIEDVDAHAKRLVGRMSKENLTDELGALERRLAYQATRQAMTEPSPNGPGTAEPVEPAETPEPVVPDNPAPAVVNEPTDDPGAPGVALAVVSTSTLPEPSRWQQLVQMGETLCRANLVPGAMRGRPADVTLVLLAAHDLGIPSYQALAKLHVIEGRLTMSAELMVGLVLGAGHRLWPDPKNDRFSATAHAQRKGDPHIVSILYTIDDAIAAGLVTLKDGAPFARSQSGKKLPWEQYTADMLWARAVSRAARRVFPDVLAGVTYTPEELGDASEWDEEEGDVETAAAAPNVDARIVTRRDEIRVEIDGLDDDEKAKLAEYWKQAHIPPLGRITDGTHLAIAEGLMQRLRNERTPVDDPDSEIADAEVVETPEPVDPEAPPCDDDPAEQPVVCALDSCGGVLGATRVEVDGKFYHRGHEPF